MKKFVKELVKTVKEKNYTIKLDNDGFYTDIEFVKNSNPEYNKHFNVEHSYECYRDADDICEYKVFNRVKTEDLIDKTKEEILNLFRHQDQLEEFVKMLNKFEITFDMLEKDEFYVTLLNEMEEQGMKIID